MAEEKTSILLSDISIKGDIVEKEKVIIDAKIMGEVNANEVVAHKNSNIKGNVNGKKIIVSGKLEGNIHADKIALKKDCDVKGVLSQKVLSIEEGANLKIKTETYE